MQENDYEDRLVGYFRKYFGIAVPFMYYNVFYKEDKNNQFFVFLDCSTF